MLVLSRTLNQPIVIGDNIFVKVVKGSQGQFKIIVDAPKDIRVIRGELYPGMAEVEARWDAALKKNKKMETKRRSENPVSSSSRQRADG